MLSEVVGEETPRDSVAVVRDLEEASPHLVRYRLLSVERRTERGRGGGRTEEEVDLWRTSAQVELLHLSSCL